MSMSQVARLEDKVAKQTERVIKEQNRLDELQQQLQEAMFSSFMARQAHSQLSFDQALDKAFGALSQGDRPRQTKNEEVRIDHD